MKIEKVFEIPFFVGEMQELLGALEERLKVNNKTWIATVNPEFVMETMKDEEFKKMLIEKTVVNVIDGIGIVWAQKILRENYIIKRLLVGFKIGVEILRGKHRENLIAGADLMDKLCELAEKKNKTVYFFGGWGDRAKGTAEYFEKKYPKLNIVGYKDENFDFRTQTDILFVAYGMKKQEKWINEHFDQLNVEIVMGVGRSFDYYSGELKRAPKWMRKMGLEWLYSLYKEPKRWKRQLVLPRFIWKTLRAV